MKPWDFWRQSFQAGKPVKEHILAQRLLGFLQRLSDRMKPSIRGRVTSFRWEGRDCGGRISESAQKKNPSWIVCGGNCFFFLWFRLFGRLLKSFLKIPHQSVEASAKKIRVKPSPVIPPNSAEMTTFHLCTALSATQRFPLFHTLMVWIFGSRSWSAGRIPTKKKRT